MPECEVGCAGRAHAIAATLGNAVWLLRKRSSRPAERRADNPGLCGGETDSASPALLHGTFERRAFPPACHPHWMAPSTVTPPQGVAWPPARTGGFQSPPRLTSRAWPKENCSTGGPHRLRPPRHAEPRPRQDSGPRPGTPWKANGTEHKGDEGEVDKLGRRLA